jgi:hypothetical protein
VAPLRAFATVAIAWLAVVIAGALESGDRLAAFDGGAQAAFAVLAAVATVVLVARRDHLDIGRTP